MSSKNLQCQFRALSKVTTKQIARAHSIYWSHSKFRGSLAKIGGCKVVPKVEPLVSENIELLKMSNPPTPPWQQLHIIIHLDFMLRMNELLDSACQRIKFSVVEIIQGGESQRILTG